MEAIGRLATGVSHDFNNMIGVVFAATHLARRGLAEGDDEAIRRALATIDDAAQRGAALSRQLLAFSQKDAARAEVVDLHDALAELQPLLDSLIPARIHLSFDLRADARGVRIDGNQLDQVLLNLVVNARDAMPQGGTLTVRTTSEPGQVSLEVIDEGVGMAADTVARAFEPFFTTKGKAGTGLGLAVVHEIVGASAGDVGIDSVPGRGTTVRLRWPLAAPAACRAPSPDAVRPCTGSERLLVVDDDAPLLEMVARVLVAHGYRVWRAATPAQARATSQQIETLDLLITDVVMPEQSGPALADALRARHPGLRTLYISGYIDREPGGVGPSDPAFLAKPFTPRDLSQRVRSLLDDERPQSGAALVLSGER